MRDKQAASKSARVGRNAIASTLPFPTMPADERLSGQLDKFGAIGGRVPRQAHIASRPCPDGVSVRLVIVSALMLSGWAPEDLSQFALNLSFAPMATPHPGP